MPAKDGWVAAVDERAKLAAEVINGRVKKALQSAGAPWRSERISQPQALQRMDAWDNPDDPAIRKHAERLSDREVIAAALDAVKLRSAAEKRGEWTPMRGGVVGGGVDVTA